MVKEEEGMRSGSWEGRSGMGGVWRRGDSGWGGGGVGGEKYCRIVGERVGTGGGGDE